MKTLSRYYKGFISWAVSAVPSGFKPKTYEVLATVILGSGVGFFIAAGLSLVFFILGYEYLFIRGRLDFIFLLFLGFAVLAVVLSHIMLRKGLLVSLHESSKTPEATSV